LEGQERELEWQRQQSHVSSSQFSVGATVPTKS
jgi:hypothetical protein